MSSIEDKLALANENVPNVYDAGKSCKEITDFSYFFKENHRLEMLPCINTCCGVIFSQMFYESATITSIPKLDTSNGNEFISMFAFCYSLTSIPELDTSNGWEFGEMFYQCYSLTSIPKLDTSNGINFPMMFAECSSLTTISELDFSSATYVEEAFSGLPNLTNIRFSGTIPISISFVDSPKLTAESLQSIVKALSVMSETETKQIITLNSKAWETLEATTPPTGSNTWKEYITNVKGWNYA